MSEPPPRHGASGQPLDESTLQWVIYIAAAGSPPHVQRNEGPRAARSCRPLTCRLRVRVRMFRLLLVVVDAACAHPLTPRVSVRQAGVCCRIIIVSDETH